MKNLVIILCFVLCVSKGVAQETLRDYKYVVVPYEFEFTDGADKYRINSLLRHLFKEKGFEVFFDVQSLPEVLQLDKCKAFYPNVVKTKGGIFKTKMHIEIRDCFGTEILVSNEGESREKAYKDAYPEAIRNAFKSFGNFNQSLESRTSDEASNTPAPSNDLEPPIVQNTTVTDSSTEVVTIEDKEPDSKDIVLFAQPVSGGYKLVNSVPEVVMELLTTSTKNLFMVKGKSATVFKKEGKWIFSEIKDGVVVEKQIMIKF